MDLDSDDKEFISATQSHCIVEDKWWDTMTQTCAFRLGTTSPAANLWSLVCHLALSWVYISPCTMGHIHDLGLLLKVPHNFQCGLSNLKILPSYCCMSDHVASHNNSSQVHIVLSVLLSEGLLATGTTAWLAKYSMAKPQHIPALLAFFCPSTASLVSSGLSTT